MLYLIRSFGSDGKSVLKLGFTDNLETRMSQYFYTNPLFERINTREGDEMSENIFHLFLSVRGFKFQVNGKLNEWFIDSPEVIRIFNETDQQEVENYLWSIRNDLFDLKRVCTSRKTLDKTVYTYLRSKYLTKTDCTFEFELIDGKPYLIEGIEQIDTEYNRFLLQNGEGIEELSNKESLFLISLGDLRELIEREVSNFLDDFYGVSQFQDKMKLYCAFMDTHPDYNKEMADLIYFKIKDEKFRRYYDFYGSQGCSAKGFIDKRLKAGMRNVTKEYELSEAIKRKFKPGDRYSKKEIKSILSNLYRDLGITKTAKASDLGEYFKLITTRVTDPLTKRVDNGFKLEDKDE